MPHMQIKGLSERGDGTGPLFPVTIAGSESKIALNRFERLDISYPVRFLCSRLLDTNCVVPG